MIVEDFLLTTPGQQVLVVVPPGSGPRSNASWSVFDAYRKESASIGASRVFERMGKGHLQFTGGIVNNPRREVQLDEAVTQFEERASATAALVGGIRGCADPERAPPEMDDWEEEFEALVEIGRLMGGAGAAGSAAMADDGSGF
jgi:hypothetical protein